MRKAERAQTERSGSGAAPLLAAQHGVVLGPSIRRLRLRWLDGEITPEEEVQLTRMVRFSTASQVLMLAGTIAILVLAADLIS